MIVFTFDTDYLTAQETARFAEEFPFPGRGTFFAWEPRPHTDMGRHEVGIHPAFEDNVPWSETLERYISEVGEDCRSARAHSCAYSHMLGIELAKRGFTSVSQATSLYQPGLHAYRHPWGLWELPIYHMDSMDLTFRHNWPELDHRPLDRQIIERSLTEPGLYVYAFHPLHILLNTSSFEQYQSVKEDLLGGTKSKFDTVFPGRGTRTFFLELIDRMESAGVESRSCSDCVPEALARSA